MAYITWSDMFSVKIDYIDEQHKQLFGIINRFHDGVKREDSRAEVLKVFNELIQYTQTHFADEEDIMEQIGVTPVFLNEHKEMHDGLMEDVFRVHTEFTSEKLSSIHDVEVFLNNWMISHVLHIDKQYEELGRTRADVVPRDKK
jgi:hemerythrin-like metal-binding protein